MSSMDTQAGRDIDVLISEEIMESRYKYLYDEQAVHIAFMGAVQAYTTMFAAGVLSAETSMQNLSDELKAAQERLDELHAMEECTKTFPPISEHSFVVPMEFMHNKGKIPAGKPLNIPGKPCDSEGSLNAQEIEGSCEGCMNSDCDADDFPCSECCRLDRADHYEQEALTAADVSPELHGGKDADHET